GERPRGVLRLAESALDVGRRLVADRALLHSAPIESLEGGQADPRLVDGGEEEEVLGALRLVLVAPNEREGAAGLLRRRGRRRGGPVVDAPRDARGGHGRPGGGAVARLMPRRVRDRRRLEQRVEVLPVGRRERLRVEVLQRYGLGRRKGRAVAGCVEVLGR